jgi:hypothetical protein
MFLREWGGSEQAAAGGHGECQETEGGKGGKLFHDVVMLETGRGLAMEKTAEWGSAFGDGGDDAVLDGEIEPLWSVVTCCGLGLTVDFNDAMRDFLGICCGLCGFERKTDE